MKSGFFDSFPPPQFLRMKPVGVSVSHDALRAIDFNEKGGTHTLNSYFEKILPVDSVVQGEIQGQKIF